MPTTLLLAPLDFQTFICVFLISVLLQRRSKHKNVLDFLIGNFLFFRYIQHYPAVNLKATRPSFCLMQFITNIILVLVLFHK